MTGGMHDDLNLIQHSSFIEGTYLLGRSSVQMTVNGSVECNDILLVINLRVSLRQLKVSFGISQSFVPLLCFIFRGRYMAATFGLFPREHYIVTF